MMRDAEVIAAVVQDLDVETPPKSETLTGRLLAELQANRQLSDEQMARLMGVDLITLRHVKVDKSKIGLLAMGRMFDAWAYDTVRDAVLKVAPDRIAQTIRKRDIERGKRLLSR